MNLSGKYLFYLRRAHTVIGLFGVFLFFIATYFGTITVFAPYINSWQNPSRHFTQIDNKTLNIDSAIYKALEKLGNPNDHIEIILPSFKDKALSIGQNLMQKIYINPYTNEILNTKNETNLITHFFNEVHEGENIAFVGRLLMGISSVCILFLTISGFYLRLAKRKSKNQKFWFKWHKNLSLVLFPYIFVFSITGSFMGFMLNTATPFAYIQTDGNQLNMRKLVGPIIFPKHKDMKKTAQTFDMLAYSKLLTKATKIYPNLKIEKIMLYRWFEKNAQIVFSGHLTDNRILTGNINRMKLILSGHDGSVIKKQELSKTHVINKFLSAFYILHFLPDEGLVIRLIYLVLGIVFALSLAFGFLIWVEKKALNNKHDTKHYNFISKLGIATMIGTMPASSFFICLYWLLPFDIYERDNLIIGSFYIFWAFTLYYSIYKKDALSVINLFMILNFVFLVLAILLHGFKTNFFIWDSFSQNLNDVFWVDFSFLIYGIFSLLFVLVSFKLKYHRSHKCSNES